MKPLLPVLVAAIVMSSAAMAQPLDIIVPFDGPGDASAPSPRFFYDDDYVYGDPWDPSFDPAAAAINALNVSNFYPRRGHSVLNIDRAITLNASGESIATHQLRCQAAHPSYDLASDTYLGSDGIPRPCRL
jgi:hypothetical protein